MVILIKQRCPCNYVFKSRKIIKPFSVGTDPIIHGPGPMYFNASNDKDNEIVSSVILSGDEPFKEVSFLAGYSSSSEDDDEVHFVICPKCGALLSPEIACTITEEES